jgi:hypothetical protein
MVTRLVKFPGCCQYRCINLSEKNNIHGAAGGINFVRVRLQCCDTVGRPRREGVLHKKMTGMCIYEYRKGTRIYLGYVFHWYLLGRHNHKYLKKVAPLDIIQGINGTEIDIISNCSRYLFLYGIDNDLGQPGNG